MKTTVTYWIVRYDTANNRITKKFVEDPSYVDSAYGRAFSYYVRKRDSGANPEFAEVTERRIR